LYPLAPWTSRRPPPGRSSIVKAQWAAERGGHQPFRTEQPRYSIITRTIETAVLPTAQRYGMGVFTYGPLSSGWLSGRGDLTRGHRASGASAAAFDLSVPASRDGHQGSGEAGRGRTASAASTAAAEVRTAGMPNR
jgi:aryl-alcohol dehydrogenase-like predicted oxidoreductase